MVQPISTTYLLYVFSNLTLNLLTKEILKQNYKHLQENKCKLCTTERNISHEPLNLSGRKTRSKKFKTPFFSRYQKILPWGNSNGSKTSPHFFFEKRSQQIWSLEALEVLAY